MAKNSQMERLELLEAEDAALTMRIEKLEGQIAKLTEEGRRAFKSGNLRSAKEKARCLKVLSRQLDQISAMKINIFECLQTEQMRQFVEGYAKAIQPTDKGGISIQAAQASIDGTVDFMEDVNELTETIAEALPTGNAYSAADDLEEMFGGLDIESEHKRTERRASPPLDTSFPAVPTRIPPIEPAASDSNSPPPAPEAAIALETHLALFN